MKALDASRQLSDLAVDHVAEVRWRLAVTPSFTALNRLLGQVAGGLLLLASDPSGARLEPHRAALRTQEGTVRRLLAELPILAPEAGLNERLAHCFDCLAPLVDWLGHRDPRRAGSDSELMAMLRQAARVRRVLLDLGRHLGGLHLVDLNCACCRPGHMGPHHIMLHSAAGES